MTTSSSHRQMLTLMSLAGTDWLNAIPTQQVLAVLEKAGFEARFVGGAVRNALLGRPVKDLDIATTAKPEQVIAVAEKAGLSVIPTGLAHGTVTVVSHGKAFEVTTLREDIATDGRHAQVQFTTAWEADAQRRDFTINALYCDARGNIFDPLGGLPDILSLTVRFIGSPDRRIAEDYLRILRFFRFFAEYSPNIPDQSALAACVRRRRGLHQLSRERVRQEFLKLLSAPRALAAVEIMYTHGLIGMVVPAAPRVNYLARLIGVYPGASPAVRLATLCLAVADDVKRLSRALKLSNDEQKELQNIAAVLHAKIKPPSLGIARQWIYKYGNKSAEQRIAYLRSATFPALADTAWSPVAELANSWIAPEFPIAGRDILALGVAPGPTVGRLLQKVEAAWLESDFALSREALLAHAQLLSSQAGIDNKSP